MDFINPTQQTTSNGNLFSTNFKFAPGGVQSDPTQNVASIINQQNAAFYSDNEDYSGDFVEDDSAVPGDGGTDSGGGNSGGSGSIKLPDGFSFTFSNQTIVTDAAGVQSVNVDVIIPPVVNADAFEVRIVKIA